MLNHLVLKTEHHTLSLSAIFVCHVIFYMKSYLILMFVKHCLQIDYLDYLLNLFHFPSNFVYMSSLSLIILLIILWSFNINYRRYLPVSCVTVNPVNHYLCDICSSYDVHRNRCKQLQKCANYILELRFLTPLIIIKF